MAKESGNKESIGRIGENIACYIVESMGFFIVERNYRKSFGEIDIVGLSRDGELVFFEVKTLINKNVYQMKPEDNLTRTKLGKLQRVCSWFANEHEDLVQPNKGWRIDLIAISIDPGSKTYAYNHYKNIS